MTYSAMPPEVPIRSKQDSYLRKEFMGQSWATSPIGNIITSQYTFNAFVTSLREHLQLANEIKLASQNTERSFDTRAERTLFQQYGRHPKSVQKYPMIQAKNPHKRDTQMSFEESRKRSLCHKCGDHWKPGHRCRPGSIRKFFHERMRKGESAVHLMSDMVLNMEGELSYLDDNPPQSTPSVGEKEPVESKTMHSQPDYDLQLFEDLTSSVVDSSVEGADGEWFTNHLSAHMSSNFDHGSPHPLPLDFQEGDKE